MALDFVKTKAGTYQVRFYVEDLTGNKVRKCLTGKTREEAERKVLDYLRHYDQLLLEQRKGPTIREAVEMYITDRDKDIEESTQRGYWAALECWVVPYAIADKHIYQVTRQDIQQWVNELAAKVSAKSQHNAHALVTAAIKYLRADFAPNTRLKPVLRKDIYVPDEREVAEIGQLVQGTRVELPFILASQCGLRASEIAALDIADITPTTIYIHQARVQGVAGDVLKAPKSRAGVRTVYITPLLYQRIVALVPPEVVQEGKGSITKMSSHMISNEWCRFRERNKLPHNLNFHALRHHFASVCLLHKIPKRYAAKMMGHEGTNMIDRVYAHEFPDELRAFGESLAAVQDSFCAKTNPREAS